MCRFGIVPDWPVYVLQIPSYAKTRALTKTWLDKRCETSYHAAISDGSLCRRGLRLADLTGRGPMKATLGFDVTISRLQVSVLIRHQQLLHLRASPDRAESHCVGPSWSNSKRDSTRDSVAHIGIALPLRSEESKHWRDTSRSPPAMPAVDDIDLQTTPFHQRSQTLIPRELDVNFWPSEFLANSLENQHVSDLGIAAAVNGST